MRLTPRSPQTVSTSDPTKAAHFPEEHKPSVEHPTEDKTVAGPPRGVEQTAPSSGLTELIFPS